MWEKQIFHSGLNAFRVIRGGDQATVELMAKFQTGQVHWARGKRFAEARAQGED
jgi:hypothetical protein